MNGRARRVARAWTFGLCLLVVPAMAAGQVTLRPTPRPLVTAENEGWFAAGEPITFAGVFYYPAGAQVYFDNNEMVRSGFYLGIPLYTRTTEEPYSRVYVPLPGGLMQPYERRRAGDLAGTVGSTSPGYPVVNPAEERSEEAVGMTGIAQAAAPPTEAPYANLPATAPRANVMVPSRPAAPAVRSPRAAAARPEAAPSGPRNTVLPKGLNAVFIEWDNTRWFNSGPTILLEPAEYVRIGDYRGFNVYRARGGGSDTIFVQLADNVTTFATPYSRRR